MIVNSIRGFSGQNFKRPYSDKNTTEGLVDNFYSQNSLYQKNIPLGNIFGAKINLNRVSFKGYYGDNNPAQKLFWILTGRTSIYEDDWTNGHIYCGAHGSAWKKWVFAHPAELLARTPEQAIQSICTLTKKTDCFPGIPDGIYSPDYGDKWGRHANYIEINPRIAATMEGNKCKEGLPGLIKLLPAIPSSSSSHANCIILSQLYPTVQNDGHNDNNAPLYSINLHSGISKNLTSDGLTRNGQRMGDDELVKAFNDLAHLRGLKTGIRMPLSAGELKVQGEEFNWYKHEKAYIDACCWAIDLGFDAIYFDSAKHVGEYDSENYHGIGQLLNYAQMQYITKQIREKTGRNDISLIGEKCNDDINHFREMGLTAGTDWGKADEFESIQWESRKQAWTRDYAAGPDISNDNDTGNISWEQRLNRLKNCLFGYENPADKLPIYMQMYDLFPFNSSTNTHDLMMNNKSYSAYGDPISHWNNIFAGSESDWYRAEINKQFAYACER